MTHLPISSNGSTDQDFALRRDSWDRLVLTMPDGRTYPDVEPVQAFPFSAPDRWISLCDAAGHEIVCLPRLDGLTPSVRQILEEELGRRQFIPVIRRIVDVTADADPSLWSVETDRGRTSFLLGSDEGICHLNASRILIIDIHGIRYLIPDLNRLDPASRRILDRYL